MHHAKIKNSKILPSNYSKRCLFSIYIKKHIPALKKKIVSLGVYMFFLSTKMNNLANASKDLEYA